MVKQEVKTAIAKAKAIRTSPRKIGLVADSIRGLSVGKAMNELTFSKRRVSGEVKKVLMAAIANAENNHNMNIDRLVISETYVGKAMVLKRFHPQAKGRAGRIIKAFSNLTIIVREQEEKV